MPTGSSYHTCSSKFPEGSRHERTAPALGHSQIISELTGSTGRHIFGRGSIPLSRVGFMFPKRTIRHPSEGECPYIVVSRVEKRQVFPLPHKDVTFATTAADNSIVISTYLPDEWRRNHKECIRTSKRCPIRDSWASSVGYRRYNCEHGRRLYGSALAPRHNPGFHHGVRGEPAGTWCTAEKCQTKEPG
jgi:hypothetical protein